MRKLVLDLHDKRAEVTEALGMSFIRAKALVRLAIEPRTMRELATLLAIDAPYTTLVVDDLEQRGLVVRTVPPDDRRVKIVTVTAAGRAEAGRAQRILHQPPAAFGALPEGDLVQLRDILLRLVEAS
jgi:DNA-binding MarR family transcriptional regulator